MSTLSSCIRAIRDAISAARFLTYYRYKRRSRESRVIGRTSVETFLDSMKKIIEYCPLTESVKARMQEEYVRLKKSPWKTVADYALPDDEMWHIIDEALLELESRT